MVKHGVLIEILTWKRGSGLLTFPAHSGFQDGSLCFQLEAVSTLGSQSMAA